MEGLVSNVLGLLHVIHLPTIDEIRNGVAALDYAAEQAILQSSFAKFTTDQHRGKYMQFTFGAHIDHVENLDEQAESVDVHGAIHYKWTNHYFTWNASENHGIERISRFVGEFLPNKPWTPRPTFAYYASHLGHENFENSSEFNKFVYEQASQLTIASNGAMILSVPFSLRVPCNFDFTSFPNDEHVCNIVIGTDFKVNAIINHDEAIYEVWGAQPNERTGEFSYRTVADEIDMWRYFGPIRKNMFSKLMYSVAIKFKRDTWKYVGLFNIPLLICVLIAQFSMVIDLEYACFLMSLVAYLFMLQLKDVGKYLPLSSDGTPLIAIMYTLAFIQIILVFFTRIAFVWVSNHFKRRENVTVIIPYLKRTVRIELLATCISHVIIAILTATITIGTLFVRSR